MSKAEEATTQPPTYAAQAQPGSYPLQQQQATPGAHSYPQQQATPAAGFAYQAQQPPPYSAQGGDGKVNPNNPTVYQAQYAAQPYYYAQPVAPGISGQPGLVQPQNVRMVPMMDTPPESHMMFSILATLCCCWPIGIFAILKSLEVTNAIARGDRPEAERNANRAYQLAKYAVIAGIVCVVISVICLIVFYAVLFNVNDIYHD